MGGLKRRGRNENRGKKGCRRMNVIDAVGKERGREGMRERAGGKTREREEEKEKRG